MQKTYKCPLCKKKLGWKPRKETEDQIHLMHFIQDTLILKEERKRRENEKTT